jgi:type II secretory pathway component GspD/PulD (secretin)
MSLFLVANSWAGSPSAWGADRTFVGVLAIAVEADVTERLGLNATTRERLVSLIDRREQEAVNLALAIKDLPPAEIEARLAPFVAESERQGMRLLTVEQRAILQQLRIAKAGMRSLSDPEVARILALTDEQQASVGQLFAERQASLTDGGAAARQIANAHFEREVAKILTDQQRAMWEQLAGLSAPGSLVAQAATGSRAQESSSVRQEPITAAQSTAQPPASSSTPSPSDRVVARQADPSDEATLRFNFQFQPWGDVIQWFAEQSDYSLQMDAAPQGTFNYRDPRSYTPSQALDLLNSVLLTKGYAIVRRNQILAVVRLDDPLPPQYIDLIPLATLENRGDYEIVRVIFPLVKMTAAEALAEIGQLVGPPGEAVPLTKSRQIMVTERAGKLRTIQSIIESIENPRNGSLSSVVEIMLDHLGPEEVLSVARPLLGLEEGQNVNDQIKLAVDPFSTRIFASADSGELINKLQEIVRLIDRAPTSTDRPITRLEQPQLFSYPITKADPNQVLQVLQTLLAGLPDVRLAIDPVTNKLIAMARPTEQRTVIETLQQLEGEAAEVAVIQLRRTDPQVVIQATNQLYGTGDEENPMKSPRVVGDPAARKLWVRGTAAEIASIRDLVEKLEGPQSRLGADRRNIRILPFSGSSAQSTLRNAELLWGALRSNQIRVVTPSAVSPSIRQRAPSTEAETQRQQNATPQTQTPAARRPANLEQTERAATNETTFTAWLDEADDESETQQVSDDSKSSGSGAGQPAAAEPSNQEGPSDIVISVTPRGVIIASEDLDALDEFEQLLRSLMEQNTLMSNEPTIFWLKYAKAESAAQTLQEVLTGVAASDGGLLVDVTSSVVSDLGGGLIAGLLGGGGAGMPTGAPSIVADTRLNALIVQASPADLNMIERLLPVIDQESGPEAVQTGGTPRLIPVYYTSAAEVATILKEVYSDRVAGAGGQQRQNNPADFIRALRGGRGGGGGAEEQTQKMAIGVDARSNTLIVTAPEPLFREVESLVADLDQEGMDSDDSLSVVTIRQSNPELIQKALQSIVGDAVQSSTTSSSTSGTAAGGASGAAADAAAQRRAEFFRQLRGAGGNRGGRGGFGGAGRGGFGGGGGGARRGGGGGGRGGR